MVQRRAKTLIDLFMTVLVLIFGGIAGTLLLQSVTSLPFWACVILGIPVGTVGAWLGLVGLAFVVFVPCEKLREWRRVRRRKRFNKS